MLFGLVAREHDDPLRPAHPPGQQTTDYGPAQRTRPPGHQDALPLKNHWYASTLRTLWDHWPWPGPSPATVEEHSRSPTGSGVNRGSGQGGDRETVQSRWEP